MAKNTDLLSAFDKLPKDEQRAFIAWFAGGGSTVTTYDSEKCPGGRFGKAECEWVDFGKVWLGKFVDMGLIIVQVERTGIAKGMIGKPKFTEYRLTPTQKGIDVIEAYWEGLRREIDG